jgi:uncharacterized damage-inducible protein DinB
MASLKMIKTFIEYHHAITRRVWDSIDQITEAQFVSDNVYSRGSIRNLMVHLTHTDRGWLNGLKNLPDLRGKLKKYEEFPDRASVRVYWESVAKDLAEYVSTLSEAELNAHPNDIPGPRWEVLLHLVNHGTDHRSTILQKLNEFGALTFDQDFIIWLASSK